MQLVSEPNTAQVVASLQCTTCPACTEPKRVKQTLCRHCYRALSATTRQRLYDRLGHGYEEAFTAAMQELGVTQITIPEGRP